MSFAQAIVITIHLVPLVSTFTFVHNSQQRLLPPIAPTPILPQSICGISSSRKARWEPSSPRRHFQSCALFESLSSSSSVEADDLPAIQNIFNKYCDKDGLMTKVALVKMSPFDEMLFDEDLMMEELNDIWDAAPKFPDVGGEDTRIDVDSFVQIYRDVDDMFEEDADETASTAKQATGKMSDVAAEEQMEELSQDATEDETVEAELEKVYESLCDKDGLISKAALMAWEEVEKLLSEGLLGDDELEELLEKTPKSPGSSDQFDVDGFLSFNVALDGLFEFEDEDEEDQTEATEESPTTRQMVEGDDLPPGVLFAAIADADYLVGMDELKLWSELQEMLDEGDLSPVEFQSMYDGIEKTESGKLNEESFAKLYDAIDALFEDDDDMGDDSGAAETSVQPVNNAVKEDLLKFIDIIIDEEMMKCGLECTVKDQNQVLNIVTALEAQPSNMITQKKGNIATTDLAGDWDLLYSSSASMKFNQGLSGIGGSFPNGQFGGLKQKLVASKYMTDVEYVERIAVVPSSASFDVKVTGVWDLRTSVSLFTGQPSIVLNIEPDRVNYGPTSTRGDHWKSLGPMNMLDVTYLDEDLRIMRGCTSPNNLFVFKKIS